MSDSCFVSYGNWFYQSLELINTSDLIEDVEMLFISDENRIQTKLLSSNAKTVEIKDDLFNVGVYNKLFKSGVLLSYYAKRVYFVLLLFYSIVIILALFFNKKSWKEIFLAVFTLASIDLFFSELLLHQYQGVWTGVWLFLFVFFILVVLIIKLKNRNKLFINLLLSLNTIVLVFVFSELFLRIYGKNKTYYESRFGYYRSEFDQRIVTDNIFYEPNTVHFLESEEFRFERQTNSLGLSDKEPKFKYSENDYLIIGLGDSFTEGDGTHADSTWLKFLEYKMPDDSINYEFINAGICGLDPFYDYKILTDKLLKYEPDLVILTIGNDLEDIIIRGGMERFDRKKTKIAAPNWEFAFQYSFVFRLAFSLYNNKYPFFLNKTSFEKEKDRAMMLLENLILDYGRLSTEKGFKLLIVFYPKSQEIVNKSYDYLNGLIDFCKSQNLEYLDLIEYYINIKGMNGSNYLNYYWEFDGHHKAAGYEKFADGVYWKLKQMNLQD